MACINPNNPIFQNLAKKLGNYMLAEIEFSKLQNEDFVIQNNGTFLNTSEEKRKEIFENYINLMDRKREGKSVNFETFNRMFDNLQVFKHKSTYIFGEWDSKNNVFKGRLMSSPGIKELYGALDVLFANVDFVASVPSDIGSMLERKGLYKLNVGKEYNFKGEDMVKNLYFSNEKLVEKVFETTPDKVTEEQVKKYDKFFDYVSLVNKLKDAYNSKGYSKIYPLLRELGIYDYNAYRLVKKIKQGNITEEDRNSVIEEIIKNAAVNRVNIDKTDLLNNPEIYNQLNNDLNKELATFLSKFGIKTELLEDIQEALDIDSFAHVDILNKILYTSKSNQEDYPQQAGKLIAFMMQHNPLVSEIMTDLRKFTKYKGLTKYEMFEAVGDLISEELHKKTKTELPKSLTEKLKILIDQFFKYLYNLNFNRINKNIGFITDNVLLQNQSLITASVFKPGAVGKKVGKISLEEALKSDKFGKDIVDKMSEHFILTGSITLAEQGTVYRPNENQIHDIDWVSTLTREKTVALFNKLYPDNVYIRTIASGVYKTNTWLIAPEGYTIKNLEYKDEKKVLKNGVAINTTNKIVGYDIVDKDGKVVSSYVPARGSKAEGHTGEIEGKLIDIFTYEKDIKENTVSKEITLKSGDKLNISDWRLTFAAKLEYGRLKDIWDYNRFIPNDNIYKDKVLPTDKIVYGHPGIGKTFAKDKIIDFDSTYKPRINKDLGLPEGDEAWDARDKLKKEQPEVYNQKVRDLWNEAKEAAKKSDKILMASDLIILREFAKDFDRFITMSPETFTDRSKQRNDYKEGDTEDWKNKVDVAMAKVDQSKIITTDKYLSDLLPKSTKTSDQTETSEEIRKAKEKDVSSQVDHKVDENWAELGTTREQQIPMNTEIKFGDLTKQVENKCK